MYSNEQVKSTVNNLMKNIEGYINHLEEEIKKDEPNLRVITMNIGKLSSTYSLVAGLTGVFTGRDTREGGIFKGDIFLSANLDETREVEPDAN